MPGLLTPLILILVVGIVVAALDFGRRGREGAGSEDDQRDDRHWFLGAIYINRDDDRVLVPKRNGFGFGRTLNLGRPISWIFVLVPVLIAVLGVQNHN